MLTIMANIKYVLIRTVNIANTFQTHSVRLISLMPHHKFIHMITTSYIKKGCICQDKLFVSEITAWYVLDLKGLASTVCNSV